MQCIRPRKVPDAGGFPATTSERAWAAEGAAMWKPPRDMQPYGSGEADWRVRKTSMRDGCGCGGCVAAGAAAGRCSRDRHCWLGSAAARRRRPAQTCVRALQHGQCLKPRGPSLFTCHQVRQRACTSSCTGRRPACTCTVSEQQVNETLWACYSKGKAEAELQIR